MSLQYLNLSIGPHNSAALGPLKVKIRTDGEVVIDATPNTGFLHRGLEKIAERLPWVGFTPFTDRIDYLASIHCNLAYALAVESLAKMDVPVRAHFIRVIAGELNRIASHLFSMGHLSSQIGAETVAMFMLRERERINNLFEMLCGARLTYNYVRIGGVAFDVTEGFIEKTYESLDYLSPKLGEYEDLLTSNLIFSGRLRGVGVIPAGRAVEMGLTGPNLRASGVDWDARKKTPYCAYSQIDFQSTVAVQDESSIPGDSFSRFMVRLKEVEQSISIVRQALEKLPAGEYRVDQKGVALEIPAGESYAAVEGPRGLFGIYVRSNGGKTPERLKIRAPSLPVLGIVPEIVAGAQISDIPTILGSLDIMVSEVDR